MRHFATLLLPGKAFKPCYISLQRNVGSIYVWHKVYHWLWYYMIYCFFLFCETASFIVLVCQCQLCWYNNHTVMLIFYCLASQNCCELVLLSLYKALHFILTLTKHLFDRMLFRQDCGWLQEKLYANIAYKRLLLTSKVMSFYNKAKDILVINRSFFLKPLYKRLQDSNVQLKQWIAFVSLIIQAGLKEAKKKNQTAKKKIDKYFPSTTLP